MFVCFPIWKSVWSAISKKAHLKWHYYKIFEPEEKESILKAFRGKEKERYSERKVKYEGPGVKMTLVFSTAILGDHSTMKTILYSRKSVDTVKNIK